MRVLVLNCGSSSIKYQVIETEDESARLIGEVERIGAGGAVLTQRWIQSGRRLREATPVRSHGEALALILQRLGLGRGRGDPYSEDANAPREQAEYAAEEALHIEAVGHRVVHGGERFAGAALVDFDVLEGIRDCFDLAPLHNPHNLAGIMAARTALPDLPHVAVFDTAFHQSLPPAAYHYALPLALYRKHGVRRYGFHGTSHRHVARRVPQLLTDLELQGPRRIISLHLGAGSSVCAIADGRSIDTSMGFTPLEGMVMGTRSGDVDPAAVLHVMARESMSAGEVLAMLNQHSGLQGLSGITSDMRDLLAEVEAGDPRAQLAIEVYLHRARRYVGAMAAVLGGVDAIAFTGGVGENAARIRRGILAGLDFLGAVEDPEKNDALTGGREGTFHQGPTVLAVVHSGEELTIARETARVLGLAS
jgi:acetate kinase